MVDPLSYPTSSFQLQHVNDYILEEQRTSFNGLQKNHKVLLGLPLLVASSALPLVIVCITLLLTLNYHVSSLLFSFVVYFCSCHKCLFSTLSNWWSVTIQILGSQFLKVVFFGSIWATTPPQGFWGTLKAVFFEFPKPSEVSCHSFLKSYVF